MDGGRLDETRPTPARAPALVGALALVVGATCLAIGIGLSPHLSKEGLSATSVVALLAALTGLALLGVGVRSVWRAGHLVARVLVVPLAVVLVATAALTLGQAVAATNVPRAALGDRTPQSVGLRHEDVTTLTDDGVRLAGWYVPSTNGAAVVLCHGAGSTRSSVLDHAAVLAARGYGVLMVDARGHGDSEGRAMDFGWHGDLDLRAAVDLLARRTDVTDGRIAVVGLSMGGEQAIGALAADDRIRAVVAEGATNRVAGDKAWLSDELGLRGLVQEQLDRLTYGATDLLTLGVATADPARLGSGGGTAPRAARRLGRLRRGGGRGPVHRGRVARLGGGLARTRRAHRRSRGRRCRVGPSCRTVPRLRPRATRVSEPSGRAPCPGRVTGVSWAVPPSHHQAHGARRTLERTVEERAMSNSNASAAGGGALYGLGIFGAWVYFWQQADAFWEYVLAVFQGLFWPAFMVYDVFVALAR